MESNRECHTCNKIFSSKSHLTRHLSTKLHLDTLNDLNNPKIRPTHVFSFKLKNKKAEIFGETLVSENVYDFIINNKYNVYMGDKYAQIRYNKETWSLHQYIYYIFLKNPRVDGMVIDHVNSDKLDNRTENLRQISYSNNNKNKLKSKNATSKYHGVTRENNMYRCRIKGNKNSFCYKNESHAAYHRDLMITELNLQEFHKMNNVDKPCDFIRKEPHVKNLNLPVGIYQNHGSNYYYKLNGTSYFGFSSVELAVSQREHEKNKLQQNQSILTNPVIIRNTDNIASINILNKNKEIVAKTTVDDDDYILLDKYSFSLSKGYACGIINHKNIKLSRYIMKCTDPNKIVDHIDGNRLNNQKCNLRIISRKENCQNKLSFKNSSSKYIGVCLCKATGMWTASITVNKKTQHIGSFKTEIDAARARNVRALEINKTNRTYYKINDL